MLTEIQETLSLKLRKFGLKIFWFIAVPERKVHFSLYQRGRGVFVQVLDNNLPGG
jgi:hypothetical protein